MLLVIILQLEWEPLLFHITSPEEVSSRVGSFRILIISSRIQVFFFLLSATLNMLALVYVFAPHNCKMAAAVPTITSSPNYRQRQKDLFLPMYPSLNKESPFPKDCTPPPEDSFSCPIGHNFLSQVRSQTNHQQEELFWLPLSTHDSSCGAEKCLNLPWNI